MKTPLPDTAAQPSDEQGYVSLHGGEDCKGKEPTSPATDDGEKEEGCRRGPITWIWAPCIPLHREACGSESLPLSRRKLGKGRRRVFATRGEEEEEEEEERKSEVE